MRIKCCIAVLQAASTLLLSACGGGDASAPLGAVIDTAASDPLVSRTNAAPSLNAAIAYIKASNTGAGDLFGRRAVALSADGTTLAVGAPSEDGNLRSESNSGAVYVFTRDTNGSWSQQALLKASNGEAGDAFGRAVALTADGAMLVVGAPSEDSGATGVNGDQANNSAPGAGAVYVFTRTGGVWTQQAYIKASNAEGGDVFGRAVALNADGTTLAVGANGEDSNASGVNGNQLNNTLHQAGAVYVFTRSGGTWSQQAYLKASNPGLGDLFGANVALSANGSTLAVSAWQEDSAATGINGDEASNAATDSGAVYVFARDRFGYWIQHAYVKASNAEAFDQFGSSIALSGDGATLAVGAYGEDSKGGGIYADQSDNSRPSSGAVYMFKRGSTGWSQKALLKGGADPYDLFGGLAVALNADGTTLAVGAHGEDSAALGINGDPSDNSQLQSGAVYTYTLNGGLWMSHAYIKASNTSANDGFGMAVALSADGATLAVGAPLEDGGTSGVNGNQLDNSAVDSGAVYVYR